MLSGNFPLSGGLYDRKIYLEGLKKEADLKSFTEKVGEVTVVAQKFLKL